MVGKPGYSPKFSHCSRSATNALFETHKNWNIGLFCRLYQLSFYGGDGEVSNTGCKAPKLDVYDLDFTGFREWLILLL